MKELIEKLETSIKELETLKESMTSTSWRNQEGILISGNEAKELLELLKNASTEQI